MNEESTLDYIKKWYANENDIEKLIFIIEKDKFKLNNIMISSEFTRYEKQTREMENQIKQLNVCLRYLKHCKSTYDYVSEIKHISKNTTTNTNTNTKANTNTKTIHGVMGQSKL